MEILTQTVEVPLWLTIIAGFLAGMFGQLGAAIYRRARGA